VYSQEWEAEEYHQYIEYLQGQGLLAPGVETLELQALQGATGLKALRVSVKLPDAPSKGSASANNQSTKVAETLRAS